MSTTKDLEYKPLKGGADPEGDQPEYSKEFSGASVTPREDQSDEPEKSSSTSDNSRRSRLKVTPRHPEELEALAERLGMSKAGVYNFALSRLAQQEGLL